MRTQLDQQIEQIADESSSERFSVIVQMESPEGNSLAEYLEATSTAIDQRGSVVSARSLVPPRRESLKTNAQGNLTKAAKKELDRVPTSASAVFIAGQSVAYIANTTLKDLGYESLRPLLDSDWVIERVAESEAGKTASKGKPEPVHFWSSGSAVLDLSRDQLAELPTKVSNIAAVYPNRTVKLPPVFKASALPGVVEDNKAYTWGLARTGALAAWGAFGARGQNVRVAVLDTGVDPHHPDLKDRVMGFAEFGRDGAVLVDDVAAARDAGSHGTHCAATVAGGSQSGRWVGMAPEAKILAGMVLKSDTTGGPIFGTDAQILGGIEWAISKGANVISMSLGGLRLAADVIDTYTRSIINANRVGIPVVVAVGNAGSQTSDSPGNDYFAFTVGATDAENRAAGFSGGRTQIIETSRYIRPEYLPVVYSKPDVSAPGVDIYSAIPGGGWEAWSGTSMATPHVAGAMALLLGKPTTISELEGTQKVNLLQALLTSTVMELGESGQNHRFGFGRIDVLRALGYAQELGYVAQEETPIEAASPATAS